MAKLYGLLGESLKHSISPKIHKMVFEYLNISGVYNLFEVKKEELNLAVEGMNTLGFVGANVTIPYKVDVMHSLHSISREAKAIGAVNTIKFKDGLAEGHNTDYYGFHMTLEKYKIPVLNKKVVILGNGGVSITVAQYMKDKGCGEIIVVGRDIQKLKKCSQFKDLNLICFSDLEHLTESDIVVNCTPVGMYPNVNETPISREIISKFSSAIDLIYNPEETLFLKYAKENGSKCVNGLYMLIGQAIASEEIWNDVKIEKEIVEEIYEKLR